MEEKRVDKVNYYLDIADAVLERSTCLRRHYGAILVRNDEIISTGYNGAPRGRQNCVDLGRCTREELQGAPAVSAMSFAAVSTQRQTPSSPPPAVRCWAVRCICPVGMPRPERCWGGTTSCSMCRRLIINAGIQEVVIRNSKTAYTVVPVSDWIREDDTMPVDCGCDSGTKG